MELGFVSAIFPELSLEQVLKFAAQHNFDCVEVMCWPAGKSERRYAGVTHIDVSNFGPQDAKRVKALIKKYGVNISGLGYYPNPLAQDEREANVYIAQLKKIIQAASLLGINTVNTFVGRDHTKSLADNWKVFDERWPEIIRFATKHKVRVCIENCPMYFSADEWPGGKNMAVSPSIWREMFSRIKSDYFGLNYDPSHLVWQMMDPVWPLTEFKNKLFHIHAKDVRVYPDKLREHGIMAHPLQYSAPKLPGLGDVNWGAFFALLTDAGYNGPVCIEVEDKAFEGSLADRKRAVVQSGNYLRQFVV